MLAAATSQPLRVEMADAPVIAGRAGGLAGSGVLEPQTNTTAAEGDADLLPLPDKPPDPAPDDSADPAYAKPYHMHGATSYTLTSAEVLQLCWASLLVATFPMVLIVILFAKFAPDVPDAIATSFNDDNLPTGFSTPRKHTVNMLVLSVLLQSLFTFVGVTLNPRSSQCAYTIYNALPAIVNKDFILAPDNIVETVKFVATAFIWLGIVCNAFIVSVVWGTFATNKQAAEAGVETDPEAWLHLDVPTSSCCLKVYAPVYFVVTMLLFVVGVLYRLASVHHYGPRESGASAP